MFQRPHPLLTRATTQFRVVYVEEAVVGDQDDVRPRWVGEILVATPIVAETTANGEAVVAERVRQLVQLCRPRRLVLWHRTPMALTLGEPLAADCVVYDCMGELSLFKMRSPPSPAA